MRWHSANSILAVHRLRRSAATSPSTLDVLALEAAIQDRYGRVDVLINNAGIMEQVDLLDRSVSDERIAQEIAVNLTGPILLTRRLLPLLRSGRNPMIVMVTSGYALLPATRAPTYSATKAGLHSFTMALRRQLRGVGIRVVEVLPPLVDTPATRSVRQRKMSPGTLVGRVLRDIERGRDEILPGTVGLLPLLMRLAPSYAARRVAEHMRRRPSGSRFIRDDKYWRYACCIDHHGTRYAIHAIVGIQHAQLRCFCLSAVRIERIPLRAGRN